MDNSSGGKDVTLDSIAIEVESDSRVASNNIQQLAQELLSLKTATSGSFRNLNNLANYLNNLKDSSLGLSSVKTELKNLSSISTSLSSLTNLGKATNLKSLIKQLQQLPNLNEQLDPTVIDNFTQKIQKLSTALEPLANNLEKINTGLKSLPTSISKINNQTNQMSTKRSTNIFTVLTKGVSGILVKLQILGQNIQKVVSRTTEMMSNASEYEEALNLFTVTLGSYAKEALSWITKFTDALHLDPSEVIQYMGSFNSLIKGLGVGSDKAYLMSKNLTQLVYDLASFKNLDIQTAFQKLQSAMSGEIEPLRNVGVALTQATLQELLYSQGLEVNVSNLDEATKAQLRYIQIMKSSTEWQTDMARTLISPSNALRVMQQEFKKLAKAIGSIFIPIVMQVLPYVMALTEMLTDLANRIASFFGYEITDIDYSNIKDGTEILGDMEKQADNTTNALRTMLAPFDELNVVQEHTKGGTGLGGLGEGLDLDLPSYDALAGLTKKLDENVEKAKKNLNALLGTAKKLAIVFGGLWATKQLLAFTGKVSDLYNILKTGNGTLDKNNTLFKRMIDRYKSARSEGNGFITSLRNMLTPAQKVVATIGGMATAFGLAYTSMKEVGNGSKSLTDVLPLLTIAVGGLATAVGLLVNPLAGIGVAITGVIGGIIGYTKGFNSVNDVVKETYTTLDNYNTKMADLKATIAQTMTADNTQIQNVQDLRNELSLLVDENGKVKKGYEDRVEYILNQLNGALGTEYKLVDGQIQQYQELEKNIDNVIAKKIAERTLDTGQSAYDEAKSRENELWKARKTAIENTTEAENNYKAITKEVEQVQDKINNMLLDPLIPRFRIEEDKKELARLKRQQTATYALYQNKKKLSDEAVKNYDKNQKLIRDYDSLTADYFANNYNRMRISADQFKDNIIQNEEDIGEAILNKLEISEYAYSQDYDLYAKYDEQKLKLAQAQRDAQIQSAKDTLVRSTQSVIDLTPSMISAWNKLSKSSSKAYTDGLNQLEPDVRQKVVSSVNALGYSSTLTTALDNAGTKLGKTLGKALGNSVTDSMKVDPTALAKKINDAFGHLHTVGGLLGLTKDLFPNITAREDGGFVPNSTLFYANEHGTPEFIGKIGNQTAVANNDQIVTSMTNAMVTAVSRMNFGGRGKTIVNVGNRTLYEGMGEYIDDDTDRYGTSYISI